MNYQYNIKIISKIISIRNKNHKYKEFKIISIRNDKCKVRYRTGSTAPARFGYGVQVLGISSSG